MGKQQILSDLDELVALAVQLKQAVIETDDPQPPDVSDVREQLKVLQERFNMDNARGQGKDNLKAQIALEQSERMRQDRHAADVLQGFAFIQQKMIAYKRGLLTCFGNLHRGY